MTETAANTPPKRNEAMRTVLMISGFFIMATAPIVGVLPGPGGTIVFAFGLAITLRNSAWAKRVYVRFKRPRSAVSPIGVCAGTARSAGVRQRKQKCRAMIDFV
jgi:hypothetical protein